MCKIKSISELHMALKDCRHHKVDLFMRMPGGQMGMRVKKAYSDYGKPVIETAAGPVGLGSEKDLKDCKFFAN